MTTPRRNLFHRYRSERRVESSKRLLARIKSRESEIKEFISNATDEPLVEEKSEETAQPKAESNFGRVLQAQEKKDGNELQMKVGDLVIILEKGDGLWKGQIAKDTGMFPPNFIELITEEEVQDFINRTQIHNLSKDELKAKMKAQKEALEVAEKEQEALREEITALKAKRKELRMEYRTANPELSCDYFGVDPLLAFFYDVQQNLVYLEDAITVNKGLKKPVNAVVDKLSEFSQELHRLSKEKALSKHYEEVAPLIQAYQNKLVLQRTDDNNIEKTKEFYKTIAKFVTVLERIVDPQKRRKKRR